MAFLLKFGRFYEIWPLSRSPIFLGYIFELCGLEIGHLAAVEEDPRQQKSMVFCPFIVPRFG
jgi:hypothetical protein